MGGFEIAVFVEDVVGWEQGFVVESENVTVLEDGDAVPEWFASLVIGCDGPDEQGGFARFRSQTFKDCRGSWDKVTFENQVEWWVSGEGEFGCEHECSAIGFGDAVRRENPVSIAFEISHGGVDLCEVDREGEGGHRWRDQRAAFSSASTSGSRTSAQSPRSSTAWTEPVSWASVRMASVSSNSPRGERSSFAVWA